MNIRFLNLDTRYYAKINNNVLDYRNERQACFAKLFYGILNDLENKPVSLYTEIMMCLNNERVEKNNGNKVFLTVEEIHFYLKELSNMIDFKYKLDIKEHGDSILTVEVTDIPYKIKWLLTCIRYMYEFPFNMALKDAVFLKMHKKFVNINLLNVFNIIGSAHNMVYGWNTNHTCGDHSYVLKLLNYANLKKIISNKAPNDSICDGVYETINHFDKANMKSVQRNEQIEDGYFSSINILNRYKEVYWNNYKRIKEINNYIQK